MEICHLIILELEEAVIRGRRLLKKYTLVFSVLKALNNIYKFQIKCQQFV